MKSLIIRYKELAIVLLFVTAFGAGLAVSPIASADPNSCSAGYHASGGKCIKTDTNNPVSDKADTNCGSGQTATQITSGKNKGKWYCKDNNSGSSGGGQQGGGSGSGGSGGSGSGGGSSGGSGSQGGKPNGVVPNNCQGNSCVDCSHVSCTDSAADPNASCGQNGCDLVQKYVNPTINVLSIIVGLIAVISIISGALMYITASGDPQKTSDAKNRIQKTIFAFVAYLFLYAFLQFLVPGGIF